MSSKKKASDDLINYLSDKYSAMDEYLQAVEEVAEDIHTFVEREDREDLFKNLWYLAEPDRVIHFRVAWEDDNQKLHTNTGFRVQHSNMLGPYKGGLRFVAGLKPDTLRFLAFEQTFKNALTGLPMGGAKGGSDFDPKGKSENEIRRFCQAFIGELSKYIGPETDIPAGDIGVSSREIAYMFHQYKKISGQFEGILTGRDPLVGGSLFRTEATGYGAVYFAKNALNKIDKDIEGMRCTVSGSGNVALHAAEKLIELNATVLSLSDSKGTAYFEEGISAEQLQGIKKGKTNKKGLDELAEEFDFEFKKDEKPWSIEADLGFACATQNEVALEDAKKMTKHGYQFLFEGANMPCQSDAHEHLRSSDVVLAPGKAVNAGGVAVSGLEISQSRSRLPWESEKVDEKLKEIMADIHDACVEYGEHDGKVDYILGANVAAFIKLSQAIKLYGLENICPSTES